MSSPDRTRSDATPMAPGIGIEKSGDTQGFGREPQVMTAELQSAAALV